MQPFTLYLTLSFLFSSFLDNLTLELTNIKGPKLVLINPLEMNKPQNLWALDFSQNPFTSVTVVGV